VLLVAIFSGMPTWGVGVLSVQLVHVMLPGMITCQAAGPDRPGSWA